LQSHTVGDDLLDSSAYGAIQRARTSKANSVLLHELYFNGMSATSTVPGPALHRAIKQRFGSIDKWAADFQASAKAASGWAMLSQHSVNGKLYNVISDKHDTGLLWMATPLIVIDVYEHAFYVDYQNRKTDYIAGFMGHIDWLEAERRFNGSCAYKQVL
jgi:Fe-Mn family superoxide dismutase